MALKKEVILNLQVTNKDAVNNIAELSKRLDELKVKRLGLNSAVKNNIMTEDEYYKAITKVDAEIKEVNASLKAYQKELSQNIAVENTNTGSIEQMRAQLALLTKQYDALSQQDREAIGGVGEQKLLEIRRLTEELNNAEQASGRFQRMVGSYEDAIRKALDGTIPMKSALRELKSDLQTLTLQYRQSATEIEKVQSSLEEIKATQGEQSKEYQDTAKRLEELRKAYDETGKKIAEMTQAAGNLQDTMKDTAQAVKSAAQDAAGIKGITEGVQLITDGYTALKAGMTALGIESEELMDVFAKIQIIQQGVNAVNRIALALQKESVLRQQAAVLWNNLTTKSIATMTAAKKADNAATVAGTAATTSFTAAEGAATTASGTLAVAVRAVGTAIKSIPVIGWILAAVAALGTLIALIHQANKADKEGEAAEQRRIKLIDEEKNIRAQVVSQTEKGIVEIKRSVQHLRECKEGSDQWNTELSNIASALGVENEWLKKNKDRVDDLVAAWINLKVAMATADAYAQKIADERTKQAELQLEAEKAINVPYKQREEYIKKLVDDGKIAADQADALAENIHKYMKETDNMGLKGLYKSRVEDIFDQNFKESEKAVERYFDKMNEAYQESVEYQTILNDARKAGDKNAVKTAEETYKKLEEIRKKRLKAEQSMADTILEGTKELLNKEVEEYRISSQKVLDNKRIELEGVRNQQKTANGVMLAELRKHETALTTEITALTEQRNKRLKELEDKANDERVRDIVNRNIELAKARMAQATTMEGQQAAQQQVISYKLELDLSQIDRDIETLKTKQDEINSILTDENEKARQAGLLGIDVDTFTAKLNENLTQINEDIAYQTQVRLNTEKAAEQESLKSTEEYAAKRAQILRNTEDANYEADFNRRMVDFYNDELMTFEQKEYAKAQIQEEYAKRRYEQAQQEYNRVSSLSNEQIAAIYGTEEEYQAAVARSKAEMESLNLAWVESVNNVGKALKDIEAKNLETAIAIGQSLEKVAGSMTGLFNTLAEDNEEYQGFATAMAMSQILISSAMSIAQAIQAAVQAGGFTGPAAVVNIPTFIAELVSIVASGIASAVAVLQKAKSVQKSAPKFAEGGIIGGKTVTGTKGRRDDVMIMASEGEFIVNAEATRKHLKELLAINGGIGGDGIYYATGGVVTQSQQQVAVTDAMMDRMRDMFVDAVQEIHPIVSVKEITSSQQRVAVKERTSRM